jgi:microsomal dipeptidase-like Zn-dependent dipeptidase
MILVAIFLILAFFFVAYVATQIVQTSAFILIIAAIVALFVVRLLVKGITLGASALGKTEESASTLTDGQKYAELAKRLNGEQFSKEQVSQDVQRNRKRMLAEKLSGSTIFKD